MIDLHRAKELGAREGGLAVAITTRADGRPRASVVNAGVLDHPVTGERVIAFVSRGVARKLEDLRVRPSITVVFRTGWDWVAVEGEASLIGPLDNPTGLAPTAILEVVRTIYAAAVGGTPEQWTGLEASFVDEQHTAVLVQPRHIYGS